MKKFFAIFSLCLISLAVMAQVMAPSDMPYRDASGRPHQVSDPSGFLTPDVRKAVEDSLFQIYKKYTVELAIALPAEIGDADPNEWCEELFSTWKIGKKDKDNGLLIMISPGSRRAYIMTGYGMEGIFTDMACRNLVDKAIIPAMREDNVDKAVTDVVSMISRALADPAAAEELRSEQSGSADLEPIDLTPLWGLVAGVALVVFVVTVVCLFRDLKRTRRMLTQYEKATHWKSQLIMYLGLSILSCGLGFIFYLIVLMIYRRTRTRSIRCSSCGVKMHRLSEKEDNIWLNDSQDFEENLQTVDYDVWECPKCGKIERFAFRANQKKYSECPACHTVAMCLVRDTVIVRPTIRQEGVGERIYECRFCHHIHRDRYKLPRQADPTAAAVAAGIATGSLRGSGGGGFGGFGGFGGGATGGGGAGGSW